MANTKSKLSCALGGVIVASVAATTLAHAAQNPFAMASLDKGYMVAAADDKMKDGKCGEGKCGAAKPKAEKPAPAADKGKMKDGKCGEGKCGGKK